MIGVENQDLHLKLKFLGVNMVRFKYKIPEKTINTFKEIAIKNHSKGDLKHIETLAFLAGYKESEFNTIVGTHLIFPHQRGNESYVEDW